MTHKGLSLLTIGIRFSSTALPFHPLHSLTDCGITELFWKKYRNALTFLVAVSLEVFFLFLAEEPAQILDSSSIIKVTPFGIV